MRKFILTTAVVGMALALMTAKTPGRSTDAAIARNLNTFNSIVKELQNNYVDSIAPDRSFGVAIDAFLSTIDPYTVYYPVEEQNELQTMTTGEYGGIGAYLLDRDSSTYIMEPMQGSPAARAGIRAGDRILRVDSIDVSRKLSADVTKVLRGRPNTMVSIKLQRPYTADSIIDVTFARELLQQPSVPFYTVVGNTGYIRLTSFINKSPEEVKEALESFKSDARVKNIVLDLRGNGGGLVESAVDILSFFVPKGTEVVRTRGREASSQRIYKTMRSPIFPDIPLAVLIDGSSASASEILAGAVQDLDRGVLIGSRSYGKGLVQTTRPLPYQGVLKFTVAKYYIPSGRLIQALDYGKRKEDGSVSRIPDSLTNVYKTRHGRTVRDGGGLQPDSVIDWGKVNRLVYNVVRDNWSFDYATKYAATHPSIPAASEFVVTDSIYDDFKKSIDPQRFKYDRVMEEAMKQLREIATEEGYMGDDTEAAFDSLSKLLIHDLNKDLDTHRSEIEEYLGSEIVGRYYYEPGKIAYMLRDDKAFKAARDILDSGKYKQILSEKPE
ncbi:MAG: S41 family peptidase [Bacteroidales bacterium]|nr:S41 family peptidase [Bacteroidales bacterium]MBD5224159.1 S41 family peptidase [Bacteroidales bacterium]